MTLPTPCAPISRRQASPAGSLRGIPRVESTLRPSSTGSPPPQPSCSCSQDRRTIHRTSFAKSTWRCRSVTPSSPSAWWRLKPAKALQYLISSTQWLDVGGRMVSEWIGDVVHAVGEPTGGLGGAGTATLIPPRPRRVDGRDEMLLAITEALELRKRVSLHGLAGVGKTALATEVAHRAAERSAHVFWMNAESSESLLASASDVVTLLALSDGGRDPTARLRRWLASQRDWLLVFDNVEDHDLMSEIVPFGSAGAVLTTSRAPLPRDDDQASFEVEPLLLDDAAELLLRRAGELESAPRRLQPSRSPSSSAPSRWRWTTPRPSWSRPGPRRPNTCRCTRPRVRVSSREQWNAGVGRSN